MKTKIYMLAIVTLAAIGFSYAQTPPGSQSVVSYGKTPSGRYAPQSVSANGETVPAAFVISDQRIGACAVNTPDGGTLTLAANARYRCIATNNAMCVRNGATITTCSRALLSSGTYVAPDQPEEMAFAPTYAADAGALNGKAVIYIQSESATGGCFACNPLTPVQ